MSLIDDPSPLARYDLVGRPEDADLKRLARLAALLCGVPTATVNLLDDEHQHNVATEGFARAVSAREESMCSRTVVLDGPVHLRDARDDPRFATSPYVTGELGSIRFYAASQLRTPAGDTVGTLCVFDEVPRELDAAQREALDELAAQVAQVLELRADRLRLSASNDELHRSNADLAAFAARIAHDLRSPIAATSGFLALAQGPFGGALGGRARECVQHAAGAVDRMATLVNDLLAYANVGARPRCEQVDVGAVADAVARDVQALVDSTGGTVEIGALPSVETDPTLLRQLLQNFVTNGLKYARPDVPPHVLVSGTGCPDGWSVSVQDNGRGIAAADRDHVFVLFVRLPDGQDVSGSGIGLATCARVAEALKARIEITDSPGGGTTFTISA
ncbi:MAG: ATP-binding protein [Mycobacteriales bacterium]